MVCWVSTHLEGCLYIDTGMDVITGMVPCTTIPVLVARIYLCAVTAIPDMFDRDPLSMSPILLILLFFFAHFAHFAHFFCSFCSFCSFFLLILLVLLIFFSTLM